MKKRLNLILNGKGGVGVTVYVAAKGAIDIREMLRRLRDREKHRIRRDRSPA